MNNKLFVMNMAFNDSTAEKGNTGNTTSSHILWIKIFNNEYHVATVN